MYSVIIQNKRTWLNRRTGFHPFFSKSLQKKEKERGVTSVNWMKPGLMEDTLPGTGVIW